MKNKKLIDILKNINLSFYTKIANNIQHITNNQLKDITLSQC